MKEIIILIVVCCNSLFAQLTTDSIYKFGYRLKVASTEPFSYVEYKSIDWADTGTSFEGYLDTILYDVQLITLDDGFSPTFATHIFQLNSKKEKIHEFENTDLMDSISIKLDPSTSYLVANGNLQTFDTIRISYHADQIPTRLTVISSKFNGLTIPIMLCKTRLTPVEMRDVYDSIRNGSKPKVVKCGTCVLGFEI